MKLALNLFTGTENYYKNPYINFKYTDGVKYLADNGCSWILDVINSYTHDKRLRGQNFQSWTLKVDGTKGVITCDDGNNNILLTQKIPFTDFYSKTQLNEVSLWLIDGVLILPSEY